MISINNIKYILVSIFALLFVLLSKNTVFANERGNIFPSQKCIEVGLVKQTEDFKFSNVISGCGFSGQKSYIRLGKADIVVRRW